MGNDEKQHKKGNKCPICSELVMSTEPPFPFCSSRCRMIDLGNWMDGAYQLSRPMTQEDLEEEL